jgi:hypothetical protein
MKLKKFTNLSIHIQILKLSYKKNSFYNKFSLKFTEILLNKIAHIIYYFHFFDKKIVFLGFPSRFFHILKKTKHVVIPEYIWYSGIFRNNNALFLKKKKKKIPNNMLKQILKLKKKTDLIMLYNLNDNTTAIKEAYLAKTPTVTICDKLNIINHKTILESTGNYNFVLEKIENTNFFFSFIEAVLKKVTKSKSNKSLTKSIKYEFLKMPIPVSQKEKGEEITKSKSTLQGK